MIPTWTARARYAYGEYCLRKDTHSMIPTWTDHAREARKHVRFALGNAIVRSVRYVAHLSATFQEGHTSAPQEPPMTTPEERHEADQDDADRYVLTSAPCMPCQRKLAARDNFAQEAELRWGRLQDALDEANATIARVVELLDPETAMAVGSIGGDRYFCESDIRAALDPTP